jgi:hypothetical protein
MDDLRLAVHCLHQDPMVELYPALKFFGSFG